MITLITGATSGIGEQLAIKYAQLGDTVIASAVIVISSPSLLNMTISKHVNLMQLTCKI